ncbi:MAG: hypothetical protein IJZ57_01710 [Clostridia bacterium]|nr:hypothetical protein [Clostridia bacterium]
MKRKLIISLAIVTLVVAFTVSFNSQQVPLANGAETNSKTGTTAFNTTYTETTTKNVTQNKFTAWTTRVTEQEKKTEETTTKKTTTTSEKTTKSKKYSQKLTTTTKTTVKPRPVTTKKTTTAKTTTSAKPTNGTGNSTAVSVVTENDLIKIRDGFLKLVNQERVRCGVKPLNINSALSSSSKIRSKEILTSFSHKRPNGKAFHTAINKDTYPYSYTAEIIQKTTHIGNRSFKDEDLFVGRDDQIVEAYTRIFNNFKNSPEHYVHIVDGKFKDTGVSVTYTINQKTGMSMFYVVQHFGVL